MRLVSQPRSSSGSIAIKPMSTTNASTNSALEMTAVRRH